MSFCKKSKVENGYSWTCKICAVILSIRKNSFFEGSKLSLQQIIIIIIYCWSKYLPQKNIAEEANIPEKYHTMTGAIFGGLNKDGTAKIVEIDESKYFHRKYHRGQWREGHWVFGGIESQVSASW
ncbi:unnamed protein product [Psylliodes chrysocephalus]|uniref:Uncharacterized protein n=1 Tax=Psylliodes chrysocephalus TaxID=3402493 RepID=A0A9P0CJ98_9CUCU|nr:unnamed protein product [Psylliodes chrysocephala]